MEQPALIGQPSPEARELVKRLLDRGLHVSFAESCTGGLCAAGLVSVPGASAVFEGGAVCYSERLKTQLLGVPAELIASAGVVSQEVALAMALGARALTGAQVAAGITGYAGPDGGDGLSVGTVCFGFLCGERQMCLTRHFPGDRARVRCAAALTVYRELCGMLDSPLSGGKE